MSRVSILLVANWKLNPAKLSDAKKIFSTALKRIPRGVSLVICPPDVFLASLIGTPHARSVSFGVQDVFSENSGAYTGQSSPLLAKNLGADFAIIGHSEKRTLGDTDEVVSKKVTAALKVGLRVILCIGEREHDSYGNYLPELQNQIEKSLAGISSQSLSSLVIAYEPLWAIGKGAGDAMTGSELHETVIFIRKVLHDRYGKKALATPVIYGGSVAPQNAARLLHEGQVAGLLVGHQSLRPEAFREIIQAVSKKS